jgi:hypothetical protein
MASRVAKFMASCCFPPFLFLFLFLLKLFFPGFWLIREKQDFWRFVTFFSFFFALSFFPFFSFFFFFLYPKVPIMKGEQEPSEKNLLMTIHQMLGGYKQNCENPVSQGFRPVLTMNTTGYHIK